MSDKEIASLRAQNANLREEVQKLKASNNSLRAKFNPMRDRLTDVEKLFETRRVDIAAAKIAARHHGFTWNDQETVEGAVRNILAVLLAERELHTKEIEKLKNWQKEEKII
jgi:hypothetical protein